MKIELRSFTQPDRYYSVDSDHGTCTCDSFHLDGWCGHLEAAGRYRPRRVTLSARPSYSQALSAVVKGIRVRNLDVAAYWLRYCWGFNAKLAGAQFRTVRRLLIGSAEDGHSIAVMEKVSDSFAAILKKNVEFPAVLAELVRICKVPNWWHPATGGHDYIRSGMLASRRALYDPAPYSLEDCNMGIHTAIAQQDRVAGLFWMIKAAGTSKEVWSTIAHLVAVIANSRGHEPALRLMRNVHLRHAKVLSGDNNFIGQAIWLMAGGDCPGLDQIEDVTDDEVMALLERLTATPPYVVPDWCCDGIHCAGNDARYTGMWPRMYAVCHEFNRYGRVDPSDLWLESEFYKLDGLHLRHSSGMVEVNSEVPNGFCNQLQTV